MEPQPLNSSLYLAGQPSSAMSPGQGKPVHLAFWRARGASHPPPHISQEQYTVAPRPLGQCQSGPAVPRLVPGCPLWPHHPHYPHARLCWAWVTGCTCPRAFAWRCLCRECTSPRSPQVCLLSSCLCPRLPASRWCCSPRSPCPGSPPVTISPYSSSGEPTCLSCSFFSLVDAPGELQEGRASSALVTAYNTVTLQALRKHLLRGDRENPERHSPLRTGQSQPQCPPEPPLSKGLGTGNALPPQE